MRENAFGGTTITPNPEATTQVLPDGTMETTFNSVGDETGVVHSHPNGNSKTGVGSGPDDDYVVNKLGVPNFTAFEGQVGVTGRVDGQYFFQVTKGGLGAMTKSQQKNTQKNLNSFQRRNQK